MSLAIAFLGLNIALVSNSSVHFKHRFSAAAAASAVRDATQAILLTIGPVVSLAGWGYAHTVVSEITQCSSCETLKRAQPCSVIY